MSYSGVTSHYNKVCYTTPSVTVPRHTQCRSETLVTDSTSGALSSKVADTTGCGALPSPWSIKMAAGQKVTLTLSDYGWGQAAGDMGCRPYAYVVEKAVGVNETICGGQERERQVYTSTSDHVLIQILPRETRQSHFLLWYDGTYGDMGTTIPYA